MRRVFHGLGSPKIRLMLGLVLTVLLTVQIALSIERNKARATPPPEDAYNPNGKISEQIKAIAERSHIELFDFCLKNYQKSYRKYSCRLEKQERLGGKLSPVQVIDIKFKEDPFSVLMVWQENAAGGDKMLYVEDPKLPADQWRMFIHPSPPWGRLLRVVEKRPDDPQVLKSSLRSIKEFGFARSMEALIGVYSGAEQAGHLIEASYLGINENSVTGRPTIVLKRVLPNGHNYPCKETIIEIDREYLVPVRVRGTNWQNETQCDYIYKNIRFNDDADVKDSDFTRKANELD